MRAPALRDPRRPGTAFGAGLLAVLSTMVAPMSSHATEEPEYQLVRTFAAIEVRQYAAYAVAEVVVPGPAGEAGSQAFPILAGYIFGKNRGERKFAMTAPVTQVDAPGGFLVQFVLPRGVWAGSAPAPEDDRVRLRDVPPTQLAAIRYSGFWSKSNDDEHLDRLRSALREAGLAWQGEPVVARYNAPFTPWFLRRNEIWLPLAPRAAGDPGR